MAIMFKRDRDPPKSLAEYLNCADYNGLVKNRGKGIRRWRMVENKQWTFQGDFIEKLDNKISKWIDRCAQLARSSSAFNDKQEEGKPRTQDPPQFIWVKGYRYRYAPPAPEEVEVEDKIPPPSAPPVQVKMESIAEDVVDYSHRQEQRPLTFLKDVCVGTDDYWASKVPSTSAAASSRTPSQIPSLLGPLPCLQPSTSTATSQTPSQIASLLGPLPCLQPSTSVATSQPPSLLLGSSSYVPPHKKQQVEAHHSSPSAHQNPKLVDDSRVDKKEYEKAKSWTPKNEEQRNALEQTKLDIFNVLVVGKGCALKYLIREFYRVTEENLDLSRIGVPDLRTLLVQMDDMIYFRRERYTGNIFIFPNLANNQFETVAHIGELVAEQRKDKNFMIPDESVLYECDITDLFQLPEWRQQQQRYTPAPVQSTYFGGYANPNYNYNDYNYYQNFYDRARSTGFSQIDYNLYMQAVSQQLNHYTQQQYYANYGCRQQGNNYYR